MAMLMPHAGPDLAAAIDVPSLHGQYPLPDVTVGSRSSRTMLVDVAMTKPGLLGQPVLAAPISPLGIPGVIRNVPPISSLSSDVERSQFPGPAVQNRDADAPHPSFVEHPAQFSPEHFPGGAPGSHLPDGPGAPGGHFPGDPGGPLPGGHGGIGSHPGAQHGNGGGVHPGSGQQGDHHGGHGSSPEGQGSSGHDGQHHSGHGHDNGDGHSDGGHDGSHDSGHGDSGGHDGGHSDHGGSSHGGHH
jgi:hypothetical protein